MPWSGRWGKMFRVFRNEWYEQKLRKLSSFEQMRVEKFEQELKESPFSGRPLGYTFFREKKFDGKRLLFLVYDKHKVVFLITITDKKAQQEDIEFIRNNFQEYGEELLQLLGKI